MTKPANLKKLHAKQDNSVKEQFESYKIFITKEFIEEFGSSFQTVEEFGNTWRKDFAYSVERQDFLEFKTRFFIRMLPEKNGITNSPRYLKNLLHLISDYLSVFVNRRNPEISRNICVDELFKKLYGAHAQHVGDVYTKQKKREWGLQQKAMRTATEKKSKKKKIQCVDSVVCKDVSLVRGESVSYQPEQRAKQLYKLIRAKRIALGLEPELKTPKIYS